MSDEAAKKEPVTAAVKAEPTKTHMASQWKHERPLTACRFDPLGRYVFSGAQDNTVQRWDIESGKMVSLAAHDSWVRGLAFSPDGEFIYTGGYDGRLISWPVAAEKPAPTRTIDAHDGWVRAVAVSPDGKHIATCGNDRHVKLWDAAEGRIVYEWPGHETHVYNIAFHPSGEHLVSCDLKGNLKQWSVADGKLVRDFASAALHKYDTTFRADIGGARSIAFNHDGSLLAAGGITNVSNAFAGIGNPAVAVFDWQTGEAKIEHGGKEKVNGVAWGVAHHADNYWIGLSGGGGGGMLYFWKPDAKDEFFKFKLPDHGRDLALHPDGLRLAVAHADGNLRIYLAAAKG